MLKIGDCISTRNIRPYFTSKSASGYLEYKSEKGKHMVFIYLGQELKDGSANLDLEKALTKLGWKPS